VGEKRSIMLGGEILSILSKGFGLRAYEKSVNISVGVGIAVPHLTRASIPVVGPLVQEDV